MCLNASAWLQVSVLSPAGGAAPAAAEEMCSEGLGRLLRVHLRPVTMEAACVLPPPWPAWTLCVHEPLR